jgi:hypothetical protein
MVSQEITTERYLGLRARVTAGEAPQDVLKDVKSILSSEADERRLVANLMQVWALVQEINALRAKEALERRASAEEPAPMCRAPMEAGESPAGRPRAHGTERVDLSRLRRDGSSGIGDQDTEGGSSSRRR